MHFEINAFNRKYRPNKPFVSLEEERRQAVAAAKAAEQRARNWARYEQQVVAREREAAAERARVAAESRVYRGPRGGKYRVVNGRKRYDVA